ncbi:MAG: capsule assembly Wzi family protein [Flavobacteriales bacterium]|nr:capsule assembly Wzi family protein [Flavobacteriales bacterium]
MRLGLFFALSIVLLTVVPSFAQEQYTYQFNHGNYAEFEGLLHVKGSEFHSGMKPYRIKQMNESFAFDSLRTINFHKSKFSRTFLGRKLFRQSMLRVDSAKYQFYVDPVFNLELGMDVVSKERLTVNTKGITFRGSIGKTVSFITSFWENQATYLPYMNTWIDKYKVVPGEGRIKDFAFDNGMYRFLGVKVKGYDFSIASGHVSYTPIKALNIQLGHDKLFVGEGYRSMLLSDVGYNYPYLKVSTTLWKFQYDFIFTQLQDTRVPVIFEAGFKKKWASFHYLSLMVGKRVQVGLFEGVVFKSDSTGNDGFNWNFFNPITLFRSVQYAYDGSGNNAVAGLNVKYVPFDGAAFYGQLAIDELDFTRMSQSGFIGQRLGWQLGFKVFDPFGLKKLYARIEYNAARPYTYAHESSLQSYTHYNQPLAHPLGANFHEVVGELGYRWHDLRFSYRLSFASIGRDSTGVNYGNDVYNPDTQTFRGADSYGNTIGQGVKSTLTYQTVELAYVVNRASNLHILLGLKHRVAKNEVATEKNAYVYFGIRTILRNLYHDF